MAASRAAETDIEASARRSADRAGAAARRQAETASEAATRRNADKSGAAARRQVETASEAAARRDNARVKQAARRAALRGATDGSAAAAAVLSGNDLLTGIPNTNAISAFFVSLHPSCCAARTGASAWSLTTDAEAVDDSVGGIGSCGASIVVADTAQIAIAFELAPCLSFCLLHDTDNTVRYNDHTTGLLQPRSIEQWDNYNA
eukprot:TRINITY_DN448_c0_g1_i6.p1 TRINITY_DN448_c0_g1~~TRINITY_DN448_c0_g1_i6.p1  ORF type:complete len:211 (+),score=21.83 TRINITY_DN448_c0_g1_i6:23-634(+)